MALNIQAARTIGVWSILFIVAAAYSDPPSQTVTSTPDVITCGKNAAAYMDSMLSDPQAFRGNISAHFKRRSEVAVIYMCFERLKMIRPALSALFKSDGVSEYDVIVSQDGGSNAVVHLPPVASRMNVLHVQHPVNLCPGQHHFFIKFFVFDILRYEYLIVIEEDNVVHPDALKVLREMLRFAWNRMPHVGLIASVDMDNSLLVDMSRYNSSTMEAEVDQGHLWVFGLHRSRYEAVRDDLVDYLNVIKGQDYSQIDQPPLREAISALIQAKGQIGNNKMSQDSFFAFSLIRKGYTSRLTTLARLFTPVGWHGLHFVGHVAQFYGVFGRGMLEGRVGPLNFINVTRDGDSWNLERDCRSRLRWLYNRYLGRDPDSMAMDDAVWRLVSGKLNAVELSKNIRDSKEHDQKLKLWLRDGFPTCIDLQPPYVHRDVCSSRTR